MARTSVAQRVATAWLSIFYIAQTLVDAIQPVSVYFDSQYRGYDGFWSTAQIGIGTPPQYLSLLPNTVSSEVWVAGPGGCDGTLTCQQARGGLFYESNSTTWDALGEYELGDTLSPTPISGQYGMDMVTISNAVAAPNQSIAIINTTELWLGSLGLNILGSQYGGSDVTRLSLITSLVHNESVIPSNSYGYTAGAYYAEQSVPGSLTLGGSDVTRYNPSGVSFKLHSGNNAPVLAIQTITVSSSVLAIPSSWNANPLTLMPQQDAAFFTVDSSTPFLWFPASVCENFASALNLTYDADIDLYVFPESTSPQNLTSLGLTFTFTLAGATTGGQTISIPISYNAFNLQLQYPFPGLKANASSAPVNYFPLRRANSSLEYVIGRSFLQEAYIVVDYERGNFSVAAAIFPDLDTVSPDLIPISRPADSELPGPEFGGSSLSVGAKAGIGVGVSIAVLAIAGIIAFFCIRKRRSPESDVSAKSEKKKTFGLLRFAKLRKNSPNTANELPADKRHPGELLADKSNTRFELPSGDDPVEMPAGDIPDSYLQRVKELESPSGDESRPNSIEKGQMVMQTSGSERSQSPVPPYSAADAAMQNKTHSSIENNTNSSSAVSPTSDQFNSGFHGTHSSGEPAVSPIANSSSASGSFPGSASLITQSVTGSQQQSTTSTNSQTRNCLHSARNSVQHGHGPSRTLSRSSRFREELSDEGSAEASEGDAPRILRQRFSFEQ